MEDYDLTQKYQEAPDLDTQEHSVFRVGFMKSILLSLLAQNKISQAQFDCCMDRICKKHTESSTQ